MFLGNWIILQALGVDSYLIHKQWLFHSYTKNTGNGRSSHPLKKDSVLLVDKALALLALTAAWQRFARSFLGVKCQSKFCRLYRGLNFEIPYLKVSMDTGMLKGSCAVGVRTDYNIQKVSFPAFLLFSFRIVAIQKRERGVKMDFLTFGGGIQSLHTLRHAVYNFVQSLLEWASLKLLAGNLAKRTSIPEGFNQCGYGCFSFVQLPAPDPVPSFSVHLINTFLEQIFLKPSCFLASMLVVFIICL